MDVLRFIVLENSPESDQKPSKSDKEFLVKKPSGSHMGLFFSAGILYATVWYRHASLVIELARDF